MWVRPRLDNDIVGEGGGIGAQGGEDGLDKRPLAIASSLTPQHGKKVLADDASGGVPDAPAQVLASLLYGENLSEECVEDRALRGGVEVDQHYLGA